MDIAALKNQGAAFSRGGIWFAAGVTVGRGWLDGDSAIMIAGAVLALVGGSWTGIANTNSSITQAFSAMPSTRRIETSDPALAEAAKRADPETVVKVTPPPKET